MRADRALKGRHSRAQGKRSAALGFSSEKGAALKGQHKNYASIRAVFFDAAGTLFQLRRPVGEIYLETAQRHGVRFSGPPPSSREISRRFERALADAPPLAFPGRSPEQLAGLERSWWLEIVKSTLRKRAENSRFSAFFEELFESFRDHRWWVLSPGVPEILQKLKNAGRHVGVISNFDSRLLDILGALELSPSLDSVTLSSRCGAAKPDPRIFHIALREAGAGKHQALHIGDSPRTDFAGALGAGLRPVLYDPAGRLADRDLWPRIRHLVDLSAFLV